MKLRTILLGTAVSAALAGAANAANNHGWYIGVEAGANWVQDVTDVFSTIGGTTTLNIDLDTGWAVIATVGYAFDNNWRVEFEGGYRGNDINSANTLAGATVFTGGNLDEITLMANVLYDISLTEKLTLSLGVGAGADYVHLELDTPGPFDLDDKDWNFAYQGIVGLSYAVGTRTDLTLNYRYLRVEDPDFVGFFQAHSLDTLEKHTVTIGLRFDLGPDEEPMAAPQPMPPEPVAAPRQFIVFFGFNKSNLTSEARRVVAEAAAAAKEYGSASILVVGHTDTVGSNGYNMRLSMRRASAVKGGLIAEGIADNAISTSGRGETELMVQTADGVKEPQNRRAEINLN